MRANIVYMYIMSKHGFVKISYSMSPWTWILVVGSGNNGHIVKMSYFLENLFVHATIKNRILIVYMYLMMSINTALLKLLNQFHDPKDQGMAILVALRLHSN